MPLLKKDEAVCSRCRKTLGRGVFRGGSCQIHTFAVFQTTRLLNEALMQDTAGQTQQGNTGNDAYGSGDASGYGAGGAGAAGAGAGAGAAAGGADAYGSQVSAI